MLWRVYIDLNLTLSFWYILKGVFLFWNRKSQANAQVCESCEVVAIFKEMPNKMPNSPALSPVLSTTHIGIQAWLTPTTRVLRLTRFFRRFTSIGHIITLSLFIFFPDSHTTPTTCMTCPHLFSSYVPPGHTICNISAPHTTCVLTYIVGLFME